MGLESALLKCTQSHPTGNTMVTGSQRYTHVDTVSQESPSFPRWSATLSHLLNTGKDMGLFFGEPASGSFYREAKRERILSH